MILNWSHNLNQDLLKSLQRWMWWTLSQVSRDEKAEPLVSGSGRRNWGVLVFTMAGMGWNKMGRNKMQCEIMLWRELRLKAVYLFEFAVTCSSYPTLFWFFFFLLSAPSLLFSLPLFNVPCLVLCAAPWLLRNESCPFAPYNWTLSILRFILFLLLCILFPYSH